MSLVPLYKYESITLSTWLPVGGVSLSPCADARTGVLTIYFCGVWNLDIESNREMKTKDIKKCYQIQDLCEEIIFQILIKVPAKYLHNKVRYMCKSWHNLISRRNFIYQNIQQNKPELLIANQQFSWEVLPYNVKILSIDDEQPLYFNLKHFPLRRMGSIRSSCNGLILVSDPTQEGLLYVMNILTKCWLRLPKCPSDCSHLYCGIGLGFDPSTEDYIIVHIYSATYGFEIFNLGCSDNAWKRIPGPFESIDELPYDIYFFNWKDPVIVKGQVLHWYVQSNRFVRSMNVSDEKSRKTFVPECCSNHDYDLVEMGGKLALVHKVSETQIDVWILEDFDGKHWIKKHSIMAESIIYRKFKPNFMELFAVASLRDGEVLVFRHKGVHYDTDRLYLYDIKQGKLRKVGTKVKKHCKFIIHRSSLVSWKNERATDSEIIQWEVSQDILHGFPFSPIKL